MKYSDARPAIRSGDVLAWSHRGWKSWYDIKLQLVRMWTRSEFCHVGVAWVVVDRVFVLEAVASGVRLMPLSQLLPAAWISRGIWNAECEKRALEALGSPYSYWDAIAGSIGKLDIGEDNRWQCSEYVSYVLSLFWTTPAEMVTELQLGEGRVLQWLNP